MEVRLSQKEKAPSPILVTLSPISTLVNEEQFDFSKIDRLLLAGGFGSFIDVNNAGKIGLIPSELIKKTETIGNAAGMGASMVLLSIRQTDMSFKLAQASYTIDLSTSDYFMSKYIDCMIF